MIRSTQQVLITGCYRSGTEYITLLLNNHPKLSATMYVVSFMRFCYNRYNPIDEKSNHSKLLSDAAQRIKKRWNRTLNVDKILDYCETADKVTYATLYDLMMSDLFLTKNIRQWAEKTQLVWTKIPAFLEMFPHGKAIHIIRDPRSVLASFKKYTYAPEPAYLGAIFNCYGSMESALDYKKKFRRYKIVRYEDIIDSPRKTLTDLFNFLGLSSNHDLLSEEGWKDTRGKLWRHNSAFMPSKTSGKKFNKQDALNRWKNNLSDREIALCEAVNGQLMETYNYKRSSVSADWPKFLKPLLSDEKLTTYLRRWLVQGQGVEEFPTDPLKQENWDENAA